MLLKKIIKNKKLIPIIFSGCIALGINNSHIYALDNNLKEKNNENTEDSVIEEDNSSTEDSLDKDESNGDSNESFPDADINKVNVITLDKIKDAQYIDKKVKVNGIVKFIESNKILIADSFGQGTLYLNNIDLSSISISDTVTATGVVQIIDNNAYIVVDNSSNLEIKKNNDTEDKEDGNENLPGNNGEKPNINSGQSHEGSGGAQKPGNLPSSSNSGVSLSQSFYIKQTYARIVKTISTDLTSSQWEKVKTAIEKGCVKVVDLPNNKIRIKQVSDGYGDRVWIVNDPRQLDANEEENIVKTIGIEAMKELSYKNYDITQSKWNLIFEDVEKGNAKFKVLDNGDLKVIYSKSGKLDETITINKK